jgi:hypothetical protein
LKLIYKAGDIIEAHIIAGLLKANGIDAHVGGHYLQGGVGDLAAMDFSTISVADENVETANAIVAEYESENKQCHKAGSENTNVFALPFIVIVICVLMILLVAIVSSN